MADSEQEVPPETQQTEVPEEPVQENVKEANESADTTQTTTEENKKAADPYYTEMPTHVPGEVDDLAKLTHLSQETLLTELKIRYERDVIYTFVSDILIAVNPFKSLPIYGKMNMQKYYKQSRSKVPPHAYMIADSAYHNLFEMNKNQCIVISGESGAGKTESAKIVMNYIIELCRNAGGDHTTNIEEQILELNPLLEAFGNAQTIMNDNSSRFGKYSRLLFDAEGAAMGVQISEYLLEKSRVVEQSHGERNFHAFYYLFASENLEHYFLSSEESYPNIGGKAWDDNKAMYEELLDSLELVGFSDEHQDSLHRILAAIIHICCIEFEEDDEASKIKDMTPINHAATLLKVPPEALSEILLGFETVARGETIKRRYRPAQAYDCRDALAKSLYASVFGWIVQSINDMLGPEVQQLKKSKGRPGAAKREKPAFEIGVLDIFGFENLETNSFEQVCINVTHEQLQYFFNQHTFRLELEEYEAEGIDGASISFRDNKPLIDMFLGYPKGFFALLNNECTFPKATDESFVGHLDENWGTSDVGYVKTRIAKGFPSFGVQHFAAEVTYNARNILEKNKDNLAANIVELMQSSGVTVVSDVFNGEILPTGQIRAVKKSDQEVRIRRGEEVQAPESPSTTKANRRAPTLATQYQNSLKTLIEHMEQCFPHFIRCIKPNYEQQANEFIDDFVMKQLGYTGVLEATRIRQEGYSWRPKFAEFVKRYKMLGFPLNKLSQVKESEASAVKIIQTVGLRDWKVGKTKLFMKFYHIDQLDAAIDKYHRDVLKVQCIVRAFFARKIYKRRLALAKMNAAERAEAEKREAEERARRQAERHEELERMRLEKEHAELVARKAEEDRLAKELEAKKAEAEVEKARQEALQNEEAEKAKQLAEEKAKEAEEARLERERALAEAENARNLIELKEQQLSELEKIAEQARQKEAEASEALKKQALERTRSRKKRKEEAEQQARLARIKAEEEARAAEEARIAREKAEEEARKLAEQQRAEEQMLQAKREAEFEEKLKKMEEEARLAKENAEKQAKAAEEAMKARQAAEEQARQAEEERKAEQERLRKEREEDAQARYDADFTRKDFSLKKRVAQLLRDSPIDAPDVQIEDRVARGWLKKLGHVRKNWRSRYFVVDLEDMMLKYYANEQCKREKASIPIDEVLRVFRPSAGSSHSGKFSRHQQLFMIETLPRTYYLEAQNAEALKMWMVILKIFTNPLVKDSQA